MGVEITPQLSRWRRDLPDKGAAGFFAAGEADLFFQAAGPFGAGAVVGQGELFAEFVPRGTLAVALQVLVDAGFEFGVAHVGRACLEREGDGVVRGVSKGKAGRTPT